MSLLSKPPKHNNKCINCKTSITTYEKTSNQAGTAEVAYCDSCEGYPCYCKSCGYGSFIVYNNPLIKSIECPRCQTHAALVQIKDAWW